MAMSDRDQMLRDIAAEYAFTASRTGRARPAAPVVEAMRRVPRESFVPAEVAHAAYDNRPLPIGQGQTISQPFIVALMTDSLEPTPAKRVLEIGTGCGYQTAVLAEIVGEVYSIEAIEALATAAEARLQRMGYDNVHLRIGNGREGWPEAAPFDGILVTAGAEEVPPKLVEQLAPGGRMVIPVGAVGQDLLLLRKNEAGELSRETLLPVAFVPLVDA
jgi:protein-L-isoaspartate(D-aspartate) O-methyltransferase